jgi:hypothetical protein
VGQTLDALSRDQFNAVVAIDAEAALRAARELTEELARGTWRGPLHGIAIGVKDLIDVQGMPTRCGSNVRARPMWTVRWWLTCGRPARSSSRSCIPTSLRTVQLATWRRKVPAATHTIRR